ncbi:MAG TPA: YqaJ viral recombinase family protein [Acidobacteriaceae bacterium]
MNAAIATHNRYYIGGGNIAGILGLSPFKTPLDEYLTIIGDQEEPSQDQLDFFARRKALEPFAIELFQRQTGKSIIRANERYTDAEHTFIRAEIDAETDSENVEIKSVHPLAAHHWGDPGADAIPTYVTAQAMHGLMVRGRRVCYPVAMIGFDDFRVYRVERDEETIAGIRAHAVAFWRNHVERMTPPPPTTSEDVLRLFPRDNGASVEATPEIIEALSELRQCKAAEKRADALAECIKVFLGEATTLTLGGKPLASYKHQSSIRFDQKAFAAEYPALFELFKRSSETRVFRIK